MQEILNQKIQEINVMLLHFVMKYVNHINLVSCVLVMHKTKYVL